MDGSELDALARRVLEACRAAGMMVTSAESCTGGLAMATLVDIPGSSDVVERGFITYSNNAKIEMLGVPPATIADHGAVSEPCARAMASGALVNSRAAIAVAITGVAGPGGGTPEKPEGLVHFACATAAGVAHQRVLFGAIGRTEVRRASVAKALEMVLSAAQTSSEA